MKICRLQCCAPAWNSKNVYESLVAVNGLCKSNIFCILPVLTLYKHSLYVRLSIFLINATTLYSWMDKLYTFVYDLRMCLNYDNLCPKKLNKGDNSRLMMCGLWYPMWFDSVEHQWWLNYMISSSPWLWRMWLFFLNLSAGVSYQFLTCIVYIWLLGDINQQVWWKIFT